MTIDDAFDARLKAAFAAAEPPADQVFVDRVTARLGRSERRRLLVVGGAALAGALVAATQVSALLKLRPVETTLHDLSSEMPAISYSDPGTLAVAALAAVAIAALAIMLPSRT